MLCLSRGIRFQLLKTEETENSLQRQPLLLTLPLYTQYVRHTERCEQLCSQGDLQPPSSNLLLRETQILNKTIQPELLETVDFGWQVSRRDPKLITLGNFSPICALAAKHRRRQMPASVFSNGKYFGAPTDYKNKFSSCSLPQLLT